VRSYLEGRDDAGGAGGGLGKLTLEQVGRKLLGDEDELDKMKRELNRARNREKVVCLFTYYAS
jgi:hypothetical protein